MLTVNKNNAILMYHYRAIRLFQYVIYNLAELIFPGR